MKELWTAQVHLLTPPAKSGDTKCFVYVVAWGKDAEDFLAYVSTICARRHWSVLEFHQVMRAGECVAVTAELAEQIERAKTGPETCIFGVRSYYPSKTA